MPVHMCARYVNNPNQSLQDAVKYLCWYLHYTWTCGLILKPTTDNQLNAYVDSEFTGMWSHTTNQLHDSTLSCTITSSLFVAALFIGLASYNQKLHSVQLKLNTLLYLCAYMTYFLCAPCSLNRHFNFGVPSGVTLTQHTTINTHMHQSTIFEDNTGCLELVNKPDQFHLQTKHISIKWHHFCDAVKNGSMVVQKIDTTLQLTNPLTKPLPHPWFEQLRWLLMG